MQVVVEEVLFVGVMLNFFILKLSARIVRQKTRIALLSALVGASVSLYQPLFVMHFLVKAILSILTGLLMLSISFKFISWKKFATLSAVFLLATFIFGGATQALKSLVGQFPLFLIALTGGAVYCISVVIHKIIFKRERISQFSYKVCIKDEGKSFSEEGYLDSGNVLYDAVTNKPIILVNFEIFKKLYQQISLAKFVTKKFNLGSIKNGHYIKINAIGRGGNMLVFTVDEVWVEEHCYKNATLGLSLSGFEKSFGRPILVHSEMV